MEPEARSGILSFRRDDIDGPEVVSALEQRGIFIGYREGGFRASPHYYNSEDEIDALADTLVSMSGPS